MSVRSPGSTASRARRSPGCGGASEWDLRWFTPPPEVDLCGHAALAASPSAGRRGSSRAASACSTRPGAVRSRRTRTALPCAASSSSNCRICRVWIAPRRAASLATPAVLR